MVTPGSVAIRMAQADVRFGRQDYRGALAAARQALALAPDSARAVLIAGLAARGLRDAALAESTYRAGVRRHPAAWELRAGYADVLLARGDSAAALAQATHAVALSGGDSLARALRERALGRNP
jgi:tetratricopeptide (TPR) repeat protein